MARTITEIQNGITATYVSEMAKVGHVVDMASWSKVNIQRLFIYVVSFYVWTLETLFDIHKSDVEADIKTQKAPTREWYATKALSYQYGFPLLKESDLFDNTGYSAAEIVASRIVTYAAVIKQTNAYGRVKLRMKLAGISGGELTRLNDNAVDAITEYFDRIGAAGDNLEITSGTPDRLKMRWRIWYDPLLLDSSGNRLDGQDSDVVRKAIKSYLAEGLKFSGVYSLTYHTDWVQQVEGIVVPEIVEAAATYGTQSFMAINQFYEPDAGWLRFNEETDLIIEYIAQGAIQ